MLHENVRERSNETSTLRPRACSRKVAIIHLLYLKLLLCNSLLSNHLGLYPQLRVDCVSESQKLYDSMHGLLRSRMPRLIFPQIACFFVSTRDVIHCHAPAALAAAVAARNPSPAGELAASAPPLPSRMLRWHIRKTLLQT